MHNSSRVSRGQRVRDLRGVFQRIPNAEALPSNEVVERVSRHVLHGDVGDALSVDLLRIDVVDRDDVGMIQRGGSFGLLNKAALVFCVESTRGQNLDRGSAAKTGIDRLVDYAHATSSELGFDAVRAE